MLLELSITGQAGPTNSMETYGYKCMFFLT